MATGAAKADGAGAGATMDEGDDEYVDPNLYSAFGVDSVLNVPASPRGGG